MRRNEYIKKHGKTAWRQQLHQKGLMEIRVNFEYRTIPNKGTVTIGELLIKREIISIDSSENGCKIRKSLPNSHYDLVIELDIATEDAFDILNSSEEFEGEIKVYGRSFIGFNQ